MMSLSSIGLKTEDEPIIAVGSDIDFRERPLPFLGPNIGLGSGSPSSSDVSETIVLDRERGPRFFAGLGTGLDDAGCVVNELFWAGDGGVRYRGCILEKLSLGL